MADNSSKLIVALDVPTFEEAQKLIDTLKDDVEIFKVGSQLFTACGPVVVRYLHGLGKKVFLDLKYHDIPNTVANAVKSAVGLGVAVYDSANKKNTNTDNDSSLFMLTVHIDGGREMLEAAVSAATQQVEALKVTKPLIVGITVLTSQEKEDNIQKIVLEKAELAKAAGLNGVVASSQEAAEIRKKFGEDFIIVTPGIRPESTDSQDQKRITTPQEAINNGSNFLVVGRPIVQADNPQSAAKDILKEIANL